MAITTKNVKALEESYDYYNMFSYTPKLGEAINALLSVATEGRMAFRVLDFIKMSDDKLRLVRPRDLQVGVSGSTGQILEGNVNDKFEAVPGFRGTTLFVGSLDALSAIESESAKGFESFKELILLCEKSGGSLNRFDGVLSPEAFPDYPALITFFFRLNQWRADTGLVTLDDEVIESAFNEALNAELEVGTTRS